jgi:hypothetical protein
VRQAVGLVGGSDASRRRHIVVQRVTWNHFDFSGLS